MYCKIATRETPDEEGRQISAADSDRGSSRILGGFIIATRDYSMIWL